MPLETIFFLLSVVHFGDSIMLFEQTAARTSLLHLSLTAIVSSDNKRRLFHGMFSPQPRCLALAVFPLVPFLIR